MAKLSAFIVDNDENTREIIKNLIQEVENVEIADVFNTISDAYNEILKEKPNFVFVSTVNNSQDVFGLIEKITLVNNKIKFIVMASSYDTNSVIKAMRAGAREFLPKPLIKEDFIKTVNRLKEQFSGNDSNTNCKIITTFSNKGGIGKTSIATNLALEIANITKEKVAIVDMNFQLGDVATFLDIKPSFDISYVVKNIDGTDNKNESYRRHSNTGGHRDQILHEETPEEVYIHAVGCSRIQALMSRLDRIKIQYLQS